MKPIFMCAVYNEEAVIIEHLNSVAPYVGGIVVCNDGSTDSTTDLVMNWIDDNVDEVWGRLITIPHTGLPETVKNKALEYIINDAWVLMLDADERIEPGTLQAIVDWINTNPAESYVWFTLQEYMDGTLTRTFLKCRLFRKHAAHFSDRIHVEDAFDGAGANFGWTVKHSKTSDKQKMRERQYVETYKKLLEEGKITAETMQACLNLHYYIKE